MERRENKNNESRSMSDRSEEQQSFDKSDLESRNAIGSERSDSIENANAAGTGAIGRSDEQKASFTINDNEDWIY